jgi:hypothetical protein
MKEATDYFGTKDKIPVGWYWIRKTIKEGKADSLSL